MKLKNVIWAVVLFFLTVIIINVGLHVTWICTRTSDKVADIFEFLAASIIVTWMLFLIAYYVWALRFYCINLGWTDADWAAKSGKGPISKSDDDDMSDATSVNVNTAEPDGNPNKDQSLGLPEGTVRATIALSLLVAGLAMTIASFSMNNTFPLNALFIDHFEFFKTGFLMMIAFYFGTKSLDILRKNPAPVIKGENATATAGTVETPEDATNPNSNAAAPASAATAQPFIVPGSRG